MDIRSGQRLSGRLGPGKQPPEQQPPPLAPGHPQLVPGEAQHVRRTGLLPIDLLQRNDPKLGEIHFAFHLLLDHVIQHQRQAPGQQDLHVGVLLIQPQIGHRIPAARPPQVLHVDVQLAVGQAAGRHQLRGQAEDGRLPSPPVRPTRRLAPCPPVLDKIPGGPAVAPPPAQQLDAGIAAEYIGLRGDDLQAEAAAFMGAGLYRPPRQGQQPLLPHQGGGHAGGLCGHIIVPDRRPLVHQHLGIAHRAPAFIPGRHNRRVPFPLHILREDKAVTTLMIRGPVQQHAVPAAGAGHTHHLGLPGLGPLIQQAPKAPVLHIFCFVDQAAPLQGRRPSIQHPMLQSLRRGTGDQPPHILHGGHLKKSARLRKPTLAAVSGSPAWPGAGRP